MEPLPNAALVSHDMVENTQQLVAADTESGSCPSEMH